MKVCDDRGIKNATKSVSALLSDQRIVIDNCSSNTIDDYELDGKVIEREKIILTNNIPKDAYINQMRPKN